MVTPKIATPKSLPRLLLTPRQFLIHRISLATKFGPPKSYKFLGTLWVLKGITTLPSSWHPTDPVIGTVALWTAWRLPGPKLPKVGEAAGLDPLVSQEWWKVVMKKCWKMISFSAVWKFEHGPSMSQPWRVVAQVNFNDRFVFNVLCIVFFKHCFCIMRFTQAKTRVN